MDYSVTTYVNGNTDSEIYTNDSLQDALMEHAVSRGYVVEEFIRSETIESTLKSIGIKYLVTTVPTIQPLIYG